MAYTSFLKSRAWQEDMHEYNWHKFGERMQHDISYIMTAKHRRRISDLAGDGIMFVAIHAT